MRRSRCSASEPKAADPHRADEGNAATIAEICVRLEGRHLAIELAAARLQVLSPGALRQHLAHRLILLTNGPLDLPARHRTRHDTIAWSEQCSAPRTGLLWHRLAVFEGGFDVRSRRDHEDHPFRACGRSGRSLTTPNEPILNALGRLLDQGLLQRTSDGCHVRFGMLETIREYACEQLERHTNLRSPSGVTLCTISAWPGGGGSRRGAHRCGLDRLEIEHDNVRAALRWSLDHEESQTAIRLCAALWWFWYIRGHLTEGRRWLDAVLASGVEPTGVRRANVLAGAGYLAISRETMPRPRGGSWRAWRFSARPGTRPVLVWCLRVSAISLGTAATLTGLRRSVRRQWRFSAAADDRWHLATAMTQLGLVAHSTGDHERAKALYERGLALQEELGDEFGMIVSVASLAGQL